ncbi:hypothetical protein GGI24_004564 [Coemansia furcata]|nr:hypothetical protein GGI24_004564 [Coemansia furcata]
MGDVTPEFAALLERLHVMEQDLGDLRTAHDELLLCNHQPAPAAAARDGTDALAKHATRFSGTGVAWSVDAWWHDTILSVQAFAPSSPAQAVLKVLHGLLDAPAKDAMQGAHPATPEEFRALLSLYFSQHDYQSRVLAAIEDETLLAGVGPHQRGQFVLRVFNNMGNSDFNAAKIATLLSCTEPGIFLMLGVNPMTVTAATIASVCERYQERLNVKTALPRPSVKRDAHQRRRASEQVVASSSASVPTTASNTGHSSTPRRAGNRPRRPSPKGPAA